MSRKLRKKGPYTMLDAKLLIENLDFARKHGTVKLVR